MTRTLCLATLLTTLLTGFAHGQTPPLVFSDTFSTAKLDKTLWVKPGWSTAICQQNGGHLRIFSNTNSTSPLQPAGVITKFALKYNKGDTLSIYGTVRVPHQLPTRPGSALTNTFEVGLGLFQSLTNANYIELTVRDTVSNRQFGVYYYSESLGFVDRYWNYAAPTNTSIFKLRLTYSCATDNIGMFWALPNSTTWTKIRPAFKMADLFGPTSPKTMTPYITGYMANVVVPREWNVWIDDYMAVFRDQPL